MRIGIVGYGAVGNMLKKQLQKTAHEIVVYDKFVDGLDRDVLRKEVSTSDLAFICVPTPQLANGACDAGAVEECVDWIDAPICIKSTVSPGTTDRLANSTGKSIVFSPEYVGETPFHPYKADPCTDLVVVGGRRQSAVQTLELYQEVLGPTPRYFLTDALTAELAKYMENAFFATKIAFVTQFYHLAHNLGVDFHLLREVWLADSRVGRSHSAVLIPPGFGGKCLPKDLAAIIEVGLRYGVDVKLLQAVQGFAQGGTDFLPTKK